MALAVCVNDSATTTGLMGVSAEAATRRYLWDTDVLAQDGSSRNAGLACYVCEYLCLHGVGGTSSEGHREWATTLMGQIRAEALGQGDAALWRWEKEPSRADYAYPPDWDDTCKGIDAVREYERRFGPTGLDLPSPARIESLLLASLYEAREVGQEVKHTCENRLALLMFMADRTKKPNNTEDVMVTAVAVRSLLRSYPQIALQNPRLFEGLVGRLLEVAEWGLVEGIPFCYISRCYFSWGHFLLLLADIGESMPQAADSVARLAPAYVRGRMYHRLLPSSLHNYLALDELGYSAILAASVGFAAQDILRSERILLASSRECRIMYQHRRLGHYYGSPAWSEIIHSLALSCPKGWGCPG